MNLIAAETTIQRLGGHADREKIYRTADKLPERGSSSDGWKDSR
jgi:hypothetical protein